MSSEMRRSSISDNINCLLDATSSAVWRRSSAPCPRAESPYRNSGLMPSESQPVVNMVYNSENNMLSHDHQESPITRPHGARRRHLPLALSRCSVALVVAFSCFASAEIASAGVQVAFSEGLQVANAASHHAASKNTKRQISPSPSFPPSSGPHTLRQGAGGAQQNGMNSLFQRMRMTPFGGKRSSSFQSLNEAVDSMLQREDLVGMKKRDAMLLDANGQHDIDQLPWPDFVQDFKDVDVESAVKKQQLLNAKNAATAAAAAAPDMIGLDCGWSCIPHPSKVHRGGEDVHIVSRAAGCTLTGVLDGVGGWAELGVDPAEYARKLAALMVDFFTARANSLPQNERPLLDILQHAFETLQQEEMAGSCTVCLSLLLPSGRLHVLNIGDSGLHVVRDGESVFATTEQQHYFNCPFQLGMGSDDRPDDADYFILEDLAPEDAIVVATDGVWDNLYEDSLMAILTEDPTASPESIARKVSEKSHLLGRDTTYVSPFSANAQKQGLRFMGGKLDDVTVVVSRVCPVKAAPDGSLLRKAKAKPLPAAATAKRAGEAVAAF